MENPSIMNNGNGNEYRYWLVMITWQFNASMNDLSMNNLPQVLTQMTQGTHQLITQQFNANNEWTKDTITQLAGCLGSRTDKVEEDQKQL